MSCSTGVVITSASEITRVYSARYLTSYSLDIFASGSEIMDEASWEHVKPSMMTSPPCSGTVSCFNKCEALSDDITTMRQNYRSPASTNAHQKKKKKQELCFQMQHVILNVELTNTSTRTNYMSNDFPVPPPMRLDEHTLSFATLNHHCST